MDVESWRRSGLRPLRWWWVGVSAAFVVVAGLIVGAWLWHQTRRLVEPERAKAQAEAVRTALAAAAGTGAALALLLAVRRQRATEYGLQLQEETITDARHDATEKADHRTSDQGH